MKALDKAKKFTDDFMANNPSFLDISTYEELENLIKRVYMAGSKNHSYIEMGYAGDYESENSND